MTTTYIVKRGDTLSRIAARLLGSPGKWRLLADLNRLTDPSHLRIGQKLQVPSDSIDAPTVVHTNGESRPLATEEVRIATEGNTVFAIGADGRWIRIGKLFRAGLARGGEHEPERFIQESASLLTDLRLSQSEINVMLATSENEGNLDAINTWDNQYLSFGIFQWTAGGTNKPGELATLLARIKRSFPGDFQHYWGRFGLDVVKHDSATGWITLGGEKLRSRDQKQKLRDHMWAYRFAQAGADSQVQAAEIVHALDRLGQFYYTKNRRLGGRALSDLITSELGVALLLDNHVNRPAYVVPCVASAIRVSGRKPEDLLDATDDSELEVLDEYLKIRATYGRYPMTNAEHRGEIVRAYVRNGCISGSCGSFQPSRR